MSEWEVLSRVINLDGTIKHVRQEGSRRHVISYSKLGRQCSERDCEINKKEDEKG